MTKEYKTKVNFFYVKSQGNVKTISIINFKIQHLPLRLVNNKTKPVFFGKGRENRPHDAHTHTSGNIILISSTRLLLQWYL